MTSNHYKHIIGTFFVAIASYILLFAFSTPAFVCSVNALFVSAMVGAALEFKDAQAGGKFDWSDMLADGIGAVLGISVIISILIMTL